MINFLSIFTPARIIAYASLGVALIFILIIVFKYIKRNKK